MTRITIGPPPPPPAPRDKKGKSLLDVFGDYVVVDLETTGLDPRWDNIIEVAAVRVVNGVVAGQFQSLINPEYEIDEFITELTGITDEMLADAPLLCDVFPSFVEFIGNDVVVAHNANFDVNFIYDNCRNTLQVDFSNDFIDTMRLSRRLFKEHSKHTLSAVVERFGIVKNVEHRALSDSLLAYECYEYMKKYASDNNIELSDLYPKASSFSAKQIQATATDFDEGTLIYDKLFVFTGVLEKMVRRDAMQLVVNMGGRCADSVTKITDYLVLGNNDYCKAIKGGKSRKQKSAEQLQLSGVDIEIISENVFYDMLGEHVAPK